MPVKPFVWRLPASCTSQMRLGLRAGAEGFCWDCKCQARKRSTLERSHTSIIRYKHAQIAAGIYVSNVKV
eukprot:scaffold102371_cov16-Tisochrysis_lutea.AAC.1